MFTCCRSGGSTRRSRRWRLGLVVETRRALSRAPGHGGIDPRRARAPTAALSIVGHRRNTAHPAARGPAASGPLRVVPTTRRIVRDQPRHGRRASPGLRGALEDRADAQPDPGGFEPGKFMSDAVSKSITYVQRNTMEVIRLGRSILTAVSRAIFIFFMTLMLAART